MDSRWIQMVLHKSSSQELLKIMDSVHDYNAVLIAMIMTRYLADNTTRRMI